MYDDSHGYIAVVSHRPMCDFDCGRESRFDGATKMGPWAYMCVECWLTHGIGRLGTGYGQKLALSAD